MRAPRRAVSQVCAGSEVVASVMEVREEVSSWRGLEDPSVLVVLLRLLLKTVAGLGRSM